MKYGFFLVFSGLYFLVSASVDAAIPFTHGLIVRVQPQTKPHSRPKSELGVLEIPVVQETEINQVLEYLAGSFTDSERRAFLKRFFSARGSSLEQFRIVGVASCAAGVCKILSGPGTSGRSPAF